MGRAKAVRSARSSMSSGGAPSGDTCARGYACLRKLPMPRRPDPKEVLASLPFEPRHDSYTVEEPDGVFVFRPTLEEMRDFPAYIAFMEAVGAESRGVAKVIPPPEFHKQEFDVDAINHMIIRSPIEQVVTGSAGQFCMINVEKKDMTVQQFRRLAESSRYSAPPKYKGKPTELERYFWRNVAFNSAIYGADVSGTVTTPEQEVWNINRLGTILDALSQDTGEHLPGVNTAYLYFGMWKAAFCWHTEDKDLYSINYIHYGAEKQWYGIPPSASERMHRFAASVFHGSARECRQFLRHKMFLLRPSVLRNNNIPVYKTVHHAGEYMVTFPAAYHAGYNLGFNIAESTNFATDRWIEYGLRASTCNCNRDAVHIDMDVFVRRFRPELWEEVCRRRAEVEEEKRRQQYLAQALSGDEEGSRDDGGGEERGGGKRGGSKGATAKGQKGRKGKANKTPTAKKAASKKGQGVSPHKKAAHETSGRMSQRHRTRRAWEKRFALERLHNMRGMERDATGSALCCVCGDRGALPQHARPSHHFTAATADDDADADHDDVDDDGSGDGIGSAKMSSGERGEVQAGDGRREGGNDRGGGAVVETEMRMQPDVANRQQHVQDKQQQQPREGESTHEVVSSECCGGDTDVVGDAGGEVLPAKRAKTQETAVPAASQGAGRLQAGQPVEAIATTAPATAPATATATAQPQPEQATARTPASATTPATAPATASTAAPAPPSATTPATAPATTPAPAAELLSSKAAADSWAATLLVCAECMIAVHPECYGTQTGELGATAPWRCQRCAANAKRAGCCLCPNLGGALKPVAAPDKQQEQRQSAPGKDVTSTAPGTHGDGGKGAPDQRDDQPQLWGSSSSSSRGGGAEGQQRPQQWVHMLCALWTPEVVFTSDALNAADISCVPKARRKLRCSLCKHDPSPLPSDLWQDADVKRLTAPRPNTGAPVQCIKGRCVTAFHVTCAARAGLAFKAAGSTAGFFCRRHTPASDSNARRHPPVDIGDRVRARWLKNHFYEGVVVDITCKQQEAKVLFSDDSTCVMPLDEVFVLAGSGSDNGNGVNQERPQQQQQMQQNPEGQKQQEQERSRLFPLTSKRISSEGTPAVQVLWEGEMLPAHLLTYVNDNKYTILFDDGYSATLQRHDVHLAHEPLPARAKLHVISASSGSADTDEHQQQQQQPQEEKEEALVDEAGDSEIMGRGQRRRTPTQKAKELDT